MKKKTIKQSTHSAQKSGEKAHASSANKNLGKNSKYKLDQYEINPQDDEGGINSFQIYDSLTKQVHDGRQLMPQLSKFDQDNSEKRNSTQGKDDQDVDEFEEDPNFFEKRTGKKRSLTDEYQKFNAKKSELMQYSGVSQQSARQHERGASTNDTISTKPTPQAYMIRSITTSNPPSAGLMSDKSQEDYLEKREVQQPHEETKDATGSFFVIPVIPDFQERDFDQQYPTNARKKIEFARDIVTSGTDEDDEELAQQQQSLEEQRKEAKQQNQSYYQYWMNKSINWKYKIPESKHFSSLAKLLTDFQKVSFDPSKPGDFPIFLLDQIYTLTPVGQDGSGKKHQQNEVRKIKEGFRNKFYSIINVTYRKGFKPLLTEDLKLIMVVDHQLKNPERAKAVRTTTDSSWGCTIRVGQMMLCQALMRHTVGYDQNIYRIVKDPVQARHYKMILKLIMDNDESHQGAFSIQNVAKMGFCHKKYPGEWYGPHAITIMLKDLNKLYQPAKNFQICIFHDGNVYYDKIKRLATTDGRINQLKKDYSNKPDKRETQCNIEFVFQKFLQQIGYFQEFKLTRAPNSDAFVADPIQPTPETTQSVPTASGTTWRNGVLVIIPCRLGLNKVNKEYFAPILSVFQCPLNVGIIGGRPNQALYFVGSQGKDLILLDPHYVQESIKGDEGLSKGHLTYHTDMMKKINLSKIDTTLAFGFYLKDEEDFHRFQAFLEEGKFIYKDNWLFSHFELKPRHFYETTEVANADQIPQHNYLPKTMQQIATTNLGFEPVSHSSIGSSSKKNTGIGLGLTLQLPSLVKSISVGQPNSKTHKLSKSQSNAGQKHDDDFELL